MVLLALLLSTTCFANSCTGSAIKFDPIFYTPQLAEQSFINRFGQSIPFSDEQIEKLACLGPEKLAELIEILQRARLPKKEKKRLIDSLQNFKGMRRF